MSEPVYFIAILRHGRAEGMLVYGQLPGHLAGKNARRNGLVYQVRLDQMSDRSWLAQPVSVLLNTWHALGEIPKTPLVEPEVAAAGEERGRYVGLRR